jgi:DNA polymerase-3 subunit delta'
VIDQLILHESTRAQLESFMARPAHALLLVGPTGIGKTAVAEALGSHLLATPNLGIYPYYLAIRPQNGSISIDAIRELQNFLRLKTIGEHPFRRLALIEHAQMLTTEGQNAFLKLLEEPPADTVIILTADSSRGLLPTILSRAQTIAITAPTEDQLKALLDKSDKSVEAGKQAYFLSGGLPGLLSAMLQDEAEHPLLASVALAKQLLQKSIFERLVAVDTLAKDKQAAAQLVDSLERIARAGLAGAAAKQSRPLITRWHVIRKSCLEARKSLHSNANTKLVLDNLFFRLG